MGSAETFIYLFENVVISCTRNKTRNPSLDSQTCWLLVTFKDIQGHRFICHSKASMRLPISDQ